MKLKLFIICLLSLSLWSESESDGDWAKYSTKEKLGFLFNMKDSQPFVAVEMTQQLIDEIKDKPEENKNTAQAFWILAQCSIRKSDTKSTLEYLSKALEYDQSLYEFRFRRAKLLNLFGEYQKAKEDLIICIKEKPGDATYQELLNTVEMNLKKS